MASLADIAQLAKVSVKTVSGALHGGDVRMSEALRLKIRAIAEELGYVPNVAARGTRMGWLPLVAIISDGVVTSPFATDIMRSIDNTVRKRQMAVFAVSRGAGRTLAQVLEETKRFRPWAVGYAAMYHKLIALPDSLASSIRVLINCQERHLRTTSIVPDEEKAAADLTKYLIARGRRRIAYIGLPGVIADDLRRSAIAASLSAAGLKLRADWVRPAVRRSVYNDRAPSLVPVHIEELFAADARPDAIICGNDRVAMSVYFALARTGIAIPDDVAVVSFDNQVDIASRLDPPLTTMALPHRAMGRMGAEVLLSGAERKHEMIRLPFELVERRSA